MNAPGVINGPPVEYSIVQSADRNNVKIYIYTNSIFSSKLELSRGWILHRDRIVR